ncbi:His-Xaa-Ser system protein HxsD [Botryobacter ruber]|uniref:His-Xaa-Ser system protein HxsD n=1 Tax=Botryobacter ruber TaxID=2171629 RepID=UPI000E0C63E9|nr:His-Xaa-Ser system protein HxsD [Botryobacter ruber]
MATKNFIKDGVITVFADTSLYSKDGIFKCLYWYGDKFHTSVAFADSETYRITLEPISTINISSEEAELYLLKLERDLIDFNLRDIVTKETKNIRDLLVAKAFSNGEFDEEPVGTLSDPVGFDVNEIEVA